MYSRVHVEVHDLFDFFLQRLGVDWRSRGTTRVVSLIFQLRTTPEHVNCFW